MNSDLRAVFLDAGGTLIHLDRVFILRCLAERGIERTPAQFAAAETEARRRVTRMVRAGGPGDDASRWVAFARTLFAVLGSDGKAADALLELVLQRHHDGLLWAYTVDGTADVLRQIRAAGFTIGVVSNADGRIHEFLARAQLLDHFDFVVDSGVVGVEKPDPAIFRIACERAGVSAAEAVHVGDFYEIDVLGARAAGVRPVLLDPDDLYADVGCDRIRAIKELPDWLSLSLCR
jgi:putative hydrolase of the HAD superfamily